MGFFQYFIVLKLITYIAATKSKSVNIALETVLEFDKDKGTDVKFLDNVQHFIDKIKTVMGNRKTARRFDIDKRNIKFTEFIKSAIETLKTYDDDDLEDVFAVLDDEIRKYHYRGCKFYELVEDQTVRRFVAKKLDDIKDKPATKLRKNLNNALQVIEDTKFSRKQSEFLDYVNSVYGQESSNKLKAFLNNLQTYSSKSKRANLNLVKVVRDGLRSVIFDHYSTLNPNARRDLKIKLETSWRNVRYPKRVEHNVWTLRYTNTIDRNKYSQPITRTKDYKKPLTTSSPKFKPHGIEESVSSELSDGQEKIQTTPYITYKPIHKQKQMKDVNFSNKKKQMKDVYFKHIRQDDKRVKKKVNIKKGSTPHSIELKWTNSKESFSSESISEVEDEVTQKSKRKPKIYKAKQEKYLSNSEEDTPQKFKHPNKKTYSFVTLYPEEITNTQKRFKIESSTQKSRVYTLWEEKITRNYDKLIKLRASKSKTNLRINKDNKRVVAESDTVIDVRRAVSSSAEDRLNRRNRQKSNNKRKPIKYRAWRGTKATQSKYKPTYKKYRKHIPRATTLEEGISIETNDNRRSMNNDNNNSSAQTELKHDVFNRINQLEKLMEEVKNRIEKTKVPNTVKLTEAEPLKSWTGTERTTERDTSTETISTSSTKSTTNLETLPANVTTITTENNDIWLTISNETITNNAIETDANTTVTKETTKVIQERPITAEKTTIIQEKPTTVNVNQNDSIPEEIRRTLTKIDINEINNENGLNNIITKYNITSEPEEPKPFNFERFLDESEIPGSDPIKANEVKDQIAKDMEKLMAEKSKDPKELSDPFQDLNTALNLMRR